MWRPGLIAMASVVLIACGGDPDEQQEAAQAPPPAENTELLDSTRATLDRARAVQDTVDEHASKLDAETRAAMGESASEADPNEDPDAKGKGE